MLLASTKAMKSGSAADDTTYTRLEDADRLAHDRT